MLQIPSNYTNSKFYISQGAITFTYQCRYFASERNTRYGLYFMEMPIFANYRPQAS
jgi:hypothetical protein